MLFRTAAAIVAVCVAMAVGPGHAHEGHDHGAPPPALTTPAAPRAEAVSEQFQLVAISRAGALELWLDRLADNSPVSGAVIEAETPTGAATAEPASDGLYRLAAPWANAPGQHDLIFTVTAGGVSDVLLGSLIIPEPMTDPVQSGGLGLWVIALAETPSALLAGGGFILGALVGLLFGRRGRAPAIAAVLLAMVVGQASAQSTAPTAAAPPDLAQRLPDGSVFAPKPTQRVLGIRTVQIALADHPRTVSLPGRIIPDPDASGVVAAAVGGRLVAPAEGFPKLGARVEANDVLARVAPSLQAIDASDVQQRAGELDQQIAIVRRRVERLTALRDVVAKSQTEEAQMELAGLLDRRRRLDASRRSPEALMAPVSGVVAASNAISGQIATPNAVIFQIVDPARLWVEALTYDALPAILTASGRLPDGRSVDLAWRGSGLSGARQAAPVHFAVIGATSALRIGQLITVLAETGERRQGLAVPRASVLRGSNGQSLVWEHVSPERFEPRTVRFEPLDGERVLILAGVEAGMRVVTQGAELLNQIR